MNFRSFKIFYRLYIVLTSNFKILNYIYNKLGNQKSMHWRCWGHSKKWINVTSTPVYALNIVWTKVEYTDTRYTLRNVVLKKKKKSRDAEIIIFAFDISTNYDWIERYVYVCIANIRTTTKNERFSSGLGIYLFTIDAKIYIYMKNRAAPTTISST